MAQPMRDDWNLARPMEIVASYPSYVEAQRAVDMLADKRFPVQDVSIVAGNLQLVEQVTGRIGYGTAALSGAVSGALTGALFGFVLGIFSLITPLTSRLVLAAWGALLGAIIGALAGLLIHALRDGQRDFASVSGIRAARYDLLVAGETAEQARRLLAELPPRRAA